MWTGWYKSVQSFENVDMILGSVKKVKIVKSCKNGKNCNSLCSYSVDYWTLPLTVLPMSIWITQPYISPYHSLINITGLSSVVRKVM